MSTSHTDQTFQPGDRVMWNPDGDPDQATVVAVGADLVQIEMDGSRQHLNVEARHLHHVND